MGNRRDLHNIEWLEKMRSFANGDGANGEVRRFGECRWRELDIIPPNFYRVFK
ncbi:hypothetical protein Sjap_017314 [Stephania japonica]|uniref:Uncharacterized protein n=1 Tax=Stephania japonica TaxID=461633 RepID=A0AAP0NJS1_9MAGN